MNRKLLGTVAALVLATGFAAPPVAAQESVEAAVEAAQQAAAQEAAAQEAPRQIKVTILGMSCPFCAYGVEQKLKKLDGVEDLEVVLETGIASLTMENGADLSNDLLKKTVKKAGFEVAKISRDFESEFPSFMKM